MKIFIIIYTCYEYLNGIKVPSTFVTSADIRLAVLAGSMVLKELDFCADAGFEIIQLQLNTYIYFLGVEFRFRRLLDSFKALGADLIN